MSAQPEDLPPQPWLMSSPRQHSAFVALLDDITPESRARLIADGIQCNRDWLDYLIELRNRQIKDLYSSGTGVQQIALLAGVSMATVNNVVRRADLPGRHRGRPLKERPDRDGNGPVGAP